MLNKLFFISLLTISAQANAWSWWPFGGGSEPEPTRIHYMYGSCEVSYNSSVSYLPWSLNFKYGWAGFDTEAELLDFARNSSHCS